MTRHTYYYKVYDGKEYFGKFKTIAEIKEFLEISANSISAIINGNNYVYDGRYKILKCY